MNDVVSAFGEGSGAREDFLDSVWQQVSKLKERDWSVPAIPRPHTVCIDFVCVCVCVAEAAGTPDRSHFVDRSRDLPILEGGNRLTD